MKHGQCVYSIGYQGKSIEALCTSLRTAGVKTLIDVRARAWSQRPQFRKTALAASLARAGIGYLHLKAAGNPFRHEADTWVACRAMYRAHLTANPAVTREVATAVRETPSALFCYEAERCDCHRGVLLDRVRRRLNVKVVDL